MTVLLTLSVVGLLSGFLLMTRVPVCHFVGTTGIDPDEKPQSSSALSRNSFTIIVPARNEEQNLPRLLSSIPELPELAEVVVVDDLSTDRTAEIAREHHAHVVSPGELPEHFTGKAWACAAGAESSEAANLLFLDADTFFMPNGVRSMVQTFAAQPSNSALSVLPYAVTEKLHEELSLFFNLLMAFGAGGFGVVRSPRLFGQSLFLSRSLYQAIGGHKSVGHYVLENFHLSQRVDAAGGQCVCFGGRGTLHMRMFPAGLKQLCNGWTKAFADGAQSTNRLTLLLSVFWISALAGIALDTVFMPHNLRLIVFLLYILAALQTLLFSRQIGTFRVFTSALFPIPLVFFFVIFARSVFRRATNRSTNWRGRNV